MLSASERLPDNGRFGGCNGEVFLFSPSSHLCRQVSRSLCGTIWRSPAPVYAGHPAFSCLDFPENPRFRKSPSRLPPGNYILPEEVYFSVSESDWGKKLGLIV